MRPEAGSRNAMRLLRRAPGVLALLALVFAGGVGAADAAAAPPAAGAAVAEALPPDHPAWADLESLWNRGGLVGLPIFTRPLPRIDIAAALVAMRTARPDLAALGPARRLERELAWELAQLGAADGRGATETAPLWVAAEGDALVRVRSDVRAAGTTTGDTGDVAAGTRGGLTLRAYLPGGAFALADVAIEKILDPSIGDAIVKSSDWYLSSEDAYVSWRTRAFDVRAGFAKHRWGPGTSGTLLLSDAAMSYPELELSRTLGPHVRAVALVGALHQPATPESGRVGPRLWFAAHRLDLGLGSRVRVGLHEAAAYRSDGMELLYAVGVIPYTLVQRWLDRATAEGASNRPQRNNVLAGMDVTWRVGGGVRADAELLVDDFATESSAQPDRLGYQLGLSWAGVTGGAATDARAEFVKVYQYTYAVFYDADLVLDGVPLGYGSGPDVEHAEVWAERDFSTDARAGLGLDWTRRGEGVAGDPWEPTTGGSRTSGSTLSGVVERRVFPHVRFRGSWRDVAEVRVHAGVLATQNRGHVRGDDDTSLHVQAEARVEW